MITHACNQYSFWRFTPERYRANALEFTATYAHNELIIIEKLEDNRLKVEFVDKQQQNDPYADMGNKVANELPY